MKRVFSIAVIALAILLAGSILGRRPPDVVKKQITQRQPSHETPTPTPTEKSVTVHSETYAYAMIKALPGDITLIANYEKKKDAATLFSANHCASGINGGFYDTSNNPLGLVIIDGQTIRKSLLSPLFNGFFWIDADSHAHITTTPPDPDSPIALQSGPIVRTNQAATFLQIREDKHARRMIAAVDTTAAVYFLTLYTKESVFDGPLLADVPALLEQIASQESLSLTDAMNLDGGSASTFYSPGLKLSELTPVGSVFCVQ